MYPWSDDLKALARKIMYIDLIQQILPPFNFRVAEATTQTTQKGDKGNEIKIKKIYK